MKYLLLLITLFAVSITLRAQILNPVNWSFSSKKIAAGKYEIHLTADVDAGWHIYSQSTPDGGPVPTTISFTKNPLVTYSGAIKETGKLEQKHEEVFGVDVKQYSNKVDFVQNVTIKANVKTSSAGSVKYMVCNDKQCLPPKTVNFSIAMQ